MLYIHLVVSYYVCGLTNDMIKTMFPNFHSVYMTLPVGTVAMERNFSQMKMIKYKSQARRKKSHLYLMKIAIGSPQK